MKVHIHLKVKFRAFGITFGNLDKAYWAELTLQGVKDYGEEKPYPSYQAKLWNKNGVLLEVSSG